MKEQLPEHKKVVVVGADQSPWTQAVVFGLTAKGYSVTLRPFPPTFRAYLRYGLVVPVCQWPDGSLTSNSFDILAKLFDENADDSRRFLARFKLMGKFLLKTNITQGSSGAGEALLQLRL